MKMTAPYNDDAVSILWNEQESKLGETTVEKSHVRLALVTAVGGVRDGDVAVAGFQTLVEGGLVDDAGTAVVGKDSDSRKARHSHPA